jgi:hypothetical protein
MQTNINSPQQKEEITYIGEDEVVLSNDGIIHNMLDAT